MVLNNRRKKLCFGLLPVLFITFLFSLSVCSDVNASSLGTSGVYFEYRNIPDNSSYTWSSQHYFPQSSTGVCDDNCFINPVYKMRRYGLLFTNQTFQGNHASIHFETNIVWYKGASASHLSPQWENLAELNVTSCNISGNGVPIESQNVSYAITPWGWDSSTNQYLRSTLTIYGDVVVSGLSGSGQINCNVGSLNYSFFNGGDYLNTYVYIEKNPASIIYSNNLDDALLNQQIAQNEVLISLQQQQIEQNNTAYNNISNQSPSDIPNSESQQTTSIINFVGSFVTALGTVQPSSCELTLPFPQFAGGTQVVNICNGKQYAPSIISIGGSLLLIGTFIPLAYIVLRLIFNEIRSWTNG